MREDRYYIEKLDVNDFCISISDEGNEKLSLEAFHIIDDENNVNKIAILRAIKSAPIAEKLNESMSWKDKIIYGRNYIHIDPNDENKITTMWICPVTLFVLGRYPKHIYIKKQ